METAESREGRPNARGLRTLQPWRDLLASIYAYSPRGVALLVSTIALASIVEGLGLAILLPIAALIFSGTGAPEERFGTLLGWLEALGIEGTATQLWVFTAMFIVWMLVRAGILIFCDRRLTEFTAAYVDHLRMKTFDAWARAPWPVVRELQKSDFISILVSDMARVVTAVQFVGRIVVTSTLVLVYTLAAFVVSPNLGFVIVGMVFVAAAFAAIWSNRSRRLGKQVTILNRKLLGLLSQFLDGLKSARALSAEKQLISQFGKTIREERKTKIEFRLQQGRLRRAIEMSGAVAIVGLLVFGYNVAGIEGTELLLLGGIVLRLVPNMLSALLGVQSTAFGLQAFSRAEAQRKELTRQAIGDMPSRAGDAATTLAPLPIGLRNVRVFAGDDASTACLLHVPDLTLPATGLVIVGGSSGAGKSTFLELLAGLYLPGQGTVQCGDISLGPSTSRTWQQRLSFLPQEPFLFSGTVRENLQWPQLAAIDESDIWANLELAGAADLVRSLDRGLDTPIRDGGARLSGGERQRICLARALIHARPVTILDEATSAVDGELQQTILENLRKLAQDRLIVFCTHAKQHVVEPDHRIVVDAGGAVREVQPA